MVGTDQFQDLSAASDIINRRKISDRRLRNEAIRQSSYDPNSFVEDNQQQIQQAQQPQQFRQAGNPLNDAVYGLPTGYTKKDLGNGTYDIFDSLGNKQGIGYNDLSSTISDLYHNQLVNKVHSYDNPEYSTPGVDTFNISIPGNEVPKNLWTYEDPLQYYDGLFGEPGARPQYNTSFNSQQEAIAAARTAPMDSRFNSGGPIGQWETLGQLLNNKMPVAHQWGDLTSDGSTENISGLNTLFGSTPVFNNGQLIGYKTDLTPGFTYKTSGNDSFDYGPTHAFINHKGKSHDWSNNAWRELTKGDWSKVNQLDQDGNVFIPTNAASSVPGWSNKDSYQRIDKEYNDGTGSILSVLGTILSFTPLAPVGVALSAAGSLANNNPLGAVLSMVNAGGGLDSLSSSLGKTLGVSPQIANSLLKGGVGALSTAAQGGNLKQSLLSGIGSGLGTYAGGEIGSFLSPQMGDSIAKMFGGAASGGINSLFAKNDPIAGSLYGGMSGGLNALLNSQDLTSPSKDKNRITPETLKQIFRK